MPEIKHGSNLAGPKLDNGYKGFSTKRSFFIESLLLVSGRGQHAPYRRSAKTHLKGSAADEVVVSPPFGLPALLFPRLVPPGCSLQTAGSDQLIAKRSSLIDTKNHSQATVNTKSAAVGPISTQNHLSSTVTASKMLAEACLRMSTFAGGRK